MDFWRGKSVLLAGTLCCRWAMVSVRSFRNREICGCHAPLQFLSVRLRSFRGLLAGVHSPRIIALPPIRYMSDALVDGEVLLRKDTIAVRAFIPSVPHDRVLLVGSADCACGDARYRFRQSSFRPSTRVFEARCRSFLGIDRACSIR